MTDRKTDIKIRCTDCAHFDTYCMANVPAWAMRDLKDMSGAWDVDGIDASECPCFAGTWR